MAKGGSQAAVASQEKSRKQAFEFNRRSMAEQKRQFEKTFAAQEAVNADMARLARVTPQGSDSTKDMAWASMEIAREASKRNSYSKYRFAS